MKNIDQILTEADVQVRQGELAAAKLALKPLLKAKLSRPENEKLAELFRRRSGLWTKASGFQYKR
jgi:hypothetical protein